MAQVSNLDGQALLPQLHSQGSDHERGLETAALDRFDNGGEISKAFGLETRGGAGSRGKISYGTRQVARDRQKANLQFLACMSLPRSVPSVEADMAPRFEPDHAKECHQRHQTDYPTSNRTTKHSNLTQNLHSRSC